VTKTINRIKQNKRQRWKQVASEHSFEAVITHCLQRKEEARCFMTYGFLTMGRLALLFRPWYRFPLCSELELLHWLPITLNEFGIKLFHVMWIALVVAWRFLRLKSSANVSENFPNITSIQSIARCRLCRLVQIQIPVFRVNNNTFQKPFTKLVCSL